MSSSLYTTQDLQGPASGRSSVMDKVHAMQAQYSDTSQLASHFLCGTVCTTLGIIVSLLMPIANILIGSVYMYECPRENLIPIYLVMAGGLVLIRGCVSGVELYRRKSGDKGFPDEFYVRPRGFVIFDVVIGVILLAWFITGNVWIFGVGWDYQSRSRAQAHYCNNALYHYAFWSTLAVYALTAALLLVFCAMAVRACGHLQLQQPQPQPQQQQQQPRQLPQQLQDWGQQGSLP